jgi:FixJ family two-component response regulator
MSPTRETVFVVDDDPAVLRSFSRLLRSARLNTVTFASPAEFLDRFDPSSPGCLVLDVSMPGLDGLELQEMLTAQGNELPILFVTGHGDIPKSVQALKRGADDFLTKPVDETDLLRAVRQALARNRSERKQRAEFAESRGRLATLTPRELEVLEGVVAGQLNKQIAGDLGAALKTVKVHRGRIMEKMGVKSLADLVRMADHLGIRKT